MLKCDFSHPSGENRGRSGASKQIEFVYSSVASITHTTHSATPTHTTCTHQLLGAQHDTISRIYIEYKLSAKYKEKKEKRKREEKIGDKGSTYTALT
jgi:hypothetical protein